MEMPRKNKVKEKLQSGQRAYVASGNSHATDIDAFGHAAVEAGIDGIWPVSYTHLTLPTT